MIQKIIIIASVLLLLFNSAAFALEAEGEIIFKDTMYGTAIGALLGAAFYLADQDDFGGKFATGVIAGAIGGLAFGLYETSSSFAEIENDEIRIAIPTPVIEKREHGVVYSASLLKARF